MSAIMPKPAHESDYVDEKDKIGPYVITRPRSLGGPQERALISEEQEVAVLREQAKAQRVEEQEAKSEGHAEKAASHADMAAYWDARATARLMGVNAMRAKVLADKAAKQAAAAKAAGAPKQP